MKNYLTNMAKSHIKVWVINVYDKDKIIKI